jgi:hypothetical protein
MLLDIARWEVVRLATLRRAMDGDRLGAASLRLLVSMLTHAQEQEWLDNRQLVTWPSYSEITKETGLSKGSITPARQELIAAGLAVPLKGLHERGGWDPIAAYRIFMKITPSAEQNEMQDHLAQIRRRWRIHKADQREIERRQAVIEAAYNGHVYIKGEP